MRVITADDHEVVLRRFVGSGTADGTPFDLSVTLPDWEAWPPAPCAWGDRVGRDGILPCLGYRGGA